MYITNFDEFLEASEKLYLSNPEKVLSILLIECGSNSVTRCGIHANTDTSMVKSC